MFAAIVFHIVTFSHTRATLGLAIVVSAALLAPLPAARSAATRPAVNQLVIGKRLYRQYCGQCHALSVALAAGFGSNSPGIGQNGGPSFNQLRVPYTYSIDAVTEPTGGHELVRKRISTTQLSEVARYIATVTSHNPIPALPTDG